MPRLGGRGQRAEAEVRLVGAGVADGDAGDLVDAAHADDPAVLGAVGPAVAGHGSDVQHAVQGRPLASDLGDATVGPPPGEPGAGDVGEGGAGGSQVHLLGHDPRAVRSGLEPEVGLAQLGLGRRRSEHDGAGQRDAEGGECCGHAGTQGMAVSQVTPRSL